MALMRPVANCDCNHNVELGNVTNLAIHELTESPGALTVPRVGEARLGHDSILLY